ncbi:MAG TPA: hypothetical protein VJ850_12665 [Candidatus Limnocylindrales bacterium]|nr:hypothetical protein [Candidatus Limnocylindrales bacterium]
MARFIGYPNRQLLGVFDSDASADRAVEALLAAGAPAKGIQRFSGPADAVRFDATGERHGIAARIRRIVQFSLMDQLPAMAWYEAALQQGRTVVAVHTTNSAETKRAVEAMKAAGGHFINRFGRLATEEFARWQGPEPPVASLMKH